MSLIKVQNLTFAYDGGYKNIFENVNFSIDTDWKLGFVGRNGRGKTTFLNLLMGKYEYSGKIFADVEFTYFPFHVPNKDRLVCEVLWDICPNAEEWEIVKELSYLAISSDTLYDNFAHLSGGEQTKVLLASLFLRDNNFLLIDEPTNHLDISARKTISDYLKRKKGFILVSHDRSFIDGCVDHILSINKTDIEVQAGNFSSWLDNFQRQQNFEMSRNEKLKKDIVRLSEAAKRTSDWADKTEASKFGKTDAGLKPDRGYVGHKSAKMMKRAKVVEARERSAIEEKSSLLKNFEENEKLKISPLRYRSSTLISVIGAEIFYGDKKVCGPLSFDIQNGDRIALNGKNGCGKSSLLKIIVGEDIKYTGIVTHSSGLTVSYVPQSVGHLRGKLNEFIENNQLDGKLFRTILSKMGVGYSEFDTDISEMSHGQRKKIALAKSLCDKAHIYVWDEPLNYIDMYSRIQLEELICEFAPTMIFVEHDETFRNTVATRVIDM